MKRGPYTLDEAIRGLTPYSEGPQFYDIVFISTTTPFVPIRRRAIKKEGINNEIRRVMKFLNIKCLPELYQSKTTLSELIVDFMFI